ncbi:hypothetical protein ABIC89_001035 [Variovorax boronicumulans]
MNHFIALMFLIVGVSLISHGLGELGATFAIGLIATGIGLYGFSTED